MKRRRCLLQEEEPANFLKTERSEFYPRNNQIPLVPTHEETTVVRSLEDLLLDGLKSPMFVLGLGYLYQQLHITCTGSFRVQITCSVIISDIRLLLLEPVTEISGL